MAKKKKIIKSEESEDKYFQYLNRFLSSLHEVQLVILIDIDGNILSYAPQDWSPEIVRSIGISSAVLMISGEKVRNIAELGYIINFLMRTTNGYLIMVASSQNRYLIAKTNTDVRIGLISLDMRRVCENIAEIPYKMPERKVSLEKKLADLENKFKDRYTVFLSYSTLDSTRFQVSKIAKTLESYMEIEKVFFWEEDSGENIVTFMEESLRKSSVFILFCSKNSIESTSVRDEWQAAFQMKKKGQMKIIPVYEDEQDIPRLLWPMLNVEFTKNNFEKFMDNLYKEILRE